MIQPKVLSHNVMGSKHTKNDDYALINHEQGIYIICDGVSEGGHGNLASELVSKQIQEKLVAANSYLKKNGSQLIGPKRLQAKQELMLNAFAETQTALQAAGAQNPNYKFASTTCITLWMDGRFAILAHIGDSRAYLYRAGKLYQITKDHSGLDELMKMGHSFEVAQKSPMAHSLSRALGSASYTQPDLLKIEFQPNDLWMLCTDGLYSPLVGLSMQQFVQAAIQGQDMKPLVQRCAQQSGDDATLVQMQFPAEMQETPLLAAERIKLIEQTPLSKYFDYIQRSHIAAICEVEEFKPGSIIIQEGTDGECMYIIAKGTLEITLKGQHLTYRRAGEYFGEVGLVQQHSKRTATAIAKDDVVLLSLKKADLFEVFKKDKEIERHFYHAMLEMTMERMLAQGEEIAQLKGL